MMASRCEPANGLETASVEVVATPPDSRHFWKRLTHLELCGQKASIVRNKIKRAPHERSSSVQPAAFFGLSDAIDMIDTFDRKRDASTKGTYCDTGTYAHFGENEPGKRIPKLGAYAETGVGLAKAVFSVFEAEARGPNASATAEAGVTGMEAMVGASAGSVSVDAGPVHIKLGLGLDTGISAGPEGLEVKLLGTGISAGRKSGFSVLGSEVKIG